MQYAGVVSADVRIATGNQNLFLVRICTRSH
jgi:hypothetical protein